MLTRIVIRDLDFADDVAQLSSTKQHIQNKTTRNDEQGGETRGPENQKRQDKGGGVRKGLQSMGKILVRFRLSIILELPLAKKKE